MQLTCALAFSYAKIRFSHDAAHMTNNNQALFDFSLVVPKINIIWPAQSVATATSRSYEPRREHICLHVRHVPVSATVASNRLKALDVDTRGIPISKQRTTEVLPIV